jgi:hypothetical protein
MAQPGWPQLHDSSIVLFASAQYWLQYLLSAVLLQLQLGCAHLSFGLSGIICTLGAHHTGCGPGRGPFKRLRK